ncbi:MAG: glycosyltransferase family 2 protein [Planctomycetota bacterium]|jgi:dolichol-phosphate mannosyltransferase
MISIVMPIWNEIDLLPELHRRVVAVADGLDDEVEILFVDDGSSDGSGDWLDEKAAADPRIGVVHFSRNFGHQPACSAGLQAARGDAVVLMDGDLQDPPEAIPDMVKAWKDGAEVVFAQRRTRDEGFLRTIAYGAFYGVFSRLMEFPIPLNAGVFGLMDRKALDAFLQLEERSRFIPGMRAWVGFREATVEYDREKRAAGAPKQTFSRLFRYAFDGITSFSYRPLRLATLLGMAASAFAILYLLRVLVFWAFDIDQDVERGYNTLAVSILFLGGVQLLTIGVLGEYVGRIYEEAKRRPLFIERSRSGCLAGDSTGPASTKDQDDDHGDEQESKAAT